MNEVRPFRALRYDPARVEIGRVLVPPYDVIAAADRARLWERDPHSAIRLEPTKDAGAEADTDYAEVAEALAAWQSSGVLLRDARPGFYALRQHFTAPDGAQGERLGCFGLLRLEDYERGSVRPHERTLAAPKAECFNALFLKRSEGGSADKTFSAQHYGPVWPAIR